MEYSVEDNSKEGGRVTVSDGQRRRLPQSMANSLKYRRTTSVFAELRDRWPESLVLCQKIVRHESEGGNIYLELDQNLIKLLSLQLRGPGQQIHQIAILRNWHTGVDSVELFQSLCDVCLVSSFVEGKTGVDCQIIVMNSKS